MLGECSMLSLAPRRRRRQQREQRTTEKKKHRKEEHIALASRISFRPYGMDSGIMIHLVRLCVCAPPRRSCSGGVCGCDLCTTHMHREEKNSEPKCVFHFHFLSFFRYGQFSQISFFPSQHKLVLYLLLCAIFIKIGSNWVYCLCEFIFGFKTQT